jgi:hypothetical protein
MKQLRLPYPLGFAAVLMISLLASFSIISQPVFAASAPPDGGGDIIDNAVLLNATSMGTGQTGINAIQSFLGSKGSFLASYNPYLDCSIAILSNQQTIDAYKAVGAPCNTNVSAAAMIYYAAQVYGVNPQVVLATMQKEQSIISAPTFDQYKVNFAMGYGCPDSGGCSTSPNSNFLWQMDNGTYTLRKNYESARGNLSWWWPVSSYVCGTPHNYYKPSLNPGASTTFYDESGVAYATYTIANAATSSFYCYTPHAYNNPSGAFGNPQFGTTGLYYSGSYNFVKYFNLWFGSTYAFMYNGTSYAAVFDPDYYLNSYPDVRAAFGNNQIAAFNHFIAYGMSEGRQGSADFSVTTYRNRYPNLRWTFGTNLPAYYWHYVVAGKAEGYSGTDSATLQPVTAYAGTDYSSVYNFPAYLATNSDISTKFSSDDTGALLHFINYGMSEGRMASNTFNVTSYMGANYDLRAAFGNNLKLYYLHYINTGQHESRIATGDYLGGATKLNGLDYSSIYSFDYYEKHNSDIQKVFGLNDNAALQHFINYGMSEGRMASPDFNVYNYKARYPDLQAAFGNNLKLYYLHYMQYGKNEGRLGS